MCTASRAPVSNLGSTAAPDGEVVLQAAARVVGGLAGCLGGDSAMLAQERIVGRAGSRIASRPGLAAAVWTIDMAVQWAVMIVLGSG